MASVPRAWLESGWILDKLHIGNAKSYESIMMFMYLSVVQCAKSVVNISIVMLDSETKITYIH